MPSIKTCSSLGPLGREEVRFCLGCAVNGVGRKLDGDIYDSISRRKVQSRAPLTTGLRELHCPISASHRCRHLLPEDQEAWSCKLPPLFAFDLLAGAPQFLPQPSSQPVNICPLLSQRLVIATGYFNSMAACIQKGSCCFYWKWQERLGEAAHWK